MYDDVTAYSQSIDVRPSIFTIQSHHFTCGYVCVCPYMSTYVCICLYMSTYVCSCLYLSIYVCMCLYVSGDMMAALAASAEKLKAHVHDGGT